MAVVWRQITAWNLVLFPVQMWLCLSGLMQQSVQAQPTCGSSECERPLPTFRSTPIAPNECYPVSSVIKVLCNIGFRQNGDNYTAACSSGGVWVPANDCRIDLFAVIVATSAALVAIFIFFLIIVIVCSCRRASKKQKRHSLSKIQGKPNKKGKKKRATGNEVAVDLGTANGQGFANGAYTTNADDEFIDDFSDDEEETVPKSKQPKPENIYENHAVGM